MCDQRNDEHDYENCEGCHACGAQGAIAVVFVAAVIVLLAVVLALAGCAHPAQAHTGHAMTYVAAYEERNAAPTNPPAVRVEGQICVDLDGQPAEAPGCRGPSVNRVGARALAAKETS